MKKTLQIMLATFCIFTSIQHTTAQNTVTVSGTSTWVGYANVFALDGTTPMFSNPWGLADIKSTLTPSTNTIKLQPNFNNYANATTAEAIAYWTNGALGNKVFEGNSYVESTTLDGQILNFTGNVTSHTLAAGYTAVAFIKGLNPSTGYSTDFSVSTPLTTTGVFNLSSVTAIPDGLLVQYGFTIKGLNGNPANEAALGNVTVTSAGAAPASVNVTFKVDMSQQTGFTTPHIAGTFNSWSDSANALTDANADGIWETTIALAPGNYEYKFLKDSWATGDEILTSGSSCTVTNGVYTNRALTVGSTNMTQATVCYASCAACTTVTEPMTAAPTPTRPAANVISMFSNAYTNVPVDTWQTVWSVGTVTNVQIQGNDTKKYTGLSFVGAETVASQINATNMQYLHVDAWTPNMTLIRIKLVDFGANGVYQGTPNDDKEHELVFNAPAQGSWISYDIPLSNFTNLTTRGNIAQFILSGNPAGSGTLFVDNVYFSDVAMANQSFANTSVKIYPNPASTSITLENESAIESVSIYNVVGQEVKTAAPNSNTITLDISNLETGVYVIKSISEGRTSTSKFVKQ